jgi:predicted RNA binding protein YcfA (HicA-like mRNA interferase family)
LRTSILADPYFAGVPSMQADRRKTAIMFHAKDDLPEVRRQVFQCLQTQAVHFFAVVRTKGSHHKKGVGTQSTEA